VKDREVHSCAICLMEIEPSVSANGGGTGEDEDEDEDEDECGLLLPCGHAFHVGCGKQWLHMNASCPNCRCDLSSRGRA
jgi:hypothetical protein